MIILPSTAWTLIKTKESFKLADLYTLQAQIILGPQNHCTRLVVDAGTGSCLLAVSNPENLILSTSFLQHCDWVGNVLVNATTASDLVHQCNLTHLPIGPWTLSYSRFSDHHRSQNFSQSTLCCCLAQCLGAPAVLNPSAAVDQLRVVHTQATLYLIQTVAKPAIPPTSLLARWSKRPFLYSSAINLNIAEIAVDILLVLLNQTASKVTLLDPTMGSGTFLATALLRNCHVAGWDCNPQCVTGSQANLEWMFGVDRVRDDCLLQVRDSSLTLSSFNRTIDCVVSNLPWGMNSVSYVDENQRILKAVRALLRVGVPCIFVTKEERTDWQESGYEKIGTTHIPPKGFLLPEGSTKTKADSEKSLRKFPSVCVITVVRSI